MPVSIGLEPASDAAANAAIATGGVIIDISPKYNTNICAAIGFTPSLINDGAIIVASNRYMADVGIPIPRRIETRAVRTRSKNKLSSPTEARISVSACPSPVRSRIAIMIPAMAPITTISAEARPPPAIESQIWVGEILLPL